MAPRKSNKTRYSQKPVVSNQESPAIEQHLMQLGVHHSLEVLDAKIQDGRATQCVFCTEFSTEE
ncbi:MAG TPA: hypothetical protein VJV96_08800 [Candidatus Angelobacter sp.]|nr:hypothetical protein [Candidatus Angelobacter sp.]